MSATHLQAGLLRPVHTNTFGLPEDDAVKLAHSVYDPGNESLLLDSEKGRTVYAEAFITNPRLGTLSDLCVRVLAKVNGVSKHPLLANDFRKQRLQYDAIDIETPLEEIYEIEDMKFWRRLALAKTKDPGLKFKPKDFNWKNEGIALKYVELVESCPAEFWPEQKMSSLAEKIKDFVTDMHIRKLKSLQDHSFDRFLVRDSDTDKATTTDVSYTTDEERPVRVSISKTSYNSEEVSGEDRQEQPNDSNEDNEERHTSKSQQPSNSSSSSSLDRLDDNEVKESVRLAERRLKRIEQRRAERRARREAQQLRREKREAKRQQREEEANKPIPRRVKVRNVFDLPVQEPSDDEDKKIDKRNIKKLLGSKKSYKYPPEHCHHIDLRFVRHFENLVSFHIQFNPPELNEKFHQRHFNFSYEDVQHLASGISNLLNLRTFCLRDSRMDAIKLEILVSSLNQLNVEEIDFGNDQLTDDAEDALFELFQNTTTITSLELEGNKLGPNTLRRMGKALKKYGGVLKYLGLAHNPIDTDSLHGLCSKIVKTPQIEDLCLAGIRLSEMGILCCIADELLRRHEVLRTLDLMAVPLSSRGGEMLITAMRTNFKLTALDVRGCNLDETTETDLAVCIKRNIYILKNPYIGDSTQTAEDIEKFLQGNKSPIYLAALEEIEKRNVCLKSRPDVAERFSASGSDSKESFTYEIEDKSTQQDIDSSQVTSSLKDVESEMIKTKEQFIYNPNEFNEEKFYEHVHLPGPGQRYHYFQSKNRMKCAYID